MSVKIILRYQDGYYEELRFNGRQDWMDDEEWSLYQRQTIEISDEEYQSYMDFVAQAEKWNTRWNQLDNEIYEREGGFV